MPQWLFDEILHVDDDRTPWAALQSTVNWMKALRHEIVSEHGLTPTAQFESCRGLFAANLNSGGAQPNRALVFEPLLHSFTFTMELLSLARLSISRSP